jgi:archaellum component FlaD/FlaE
MIEKDKELSKKRYTYDFHGNLLFMKKLNGDKIGKGTLHIPYAWQPSEQELKETNDRETKLKDAARYAFKNPVNKPKTAKLYNIPKNFSKSMIPSKFNYEENGNFELMKPK